MTSAPEIRTPRDLADLRTWLLEQWQYDKIFARAARAMGSSTNNQFEGNNDTWERRTLAGAELYWVSEEMVDLLLATADSVPDDVTPNDMVPPAPQGLVVFSKPWYGTDAAVPDKKIEIDAMLWGGSHLGRIPGDPKRDKPGGFISISTSMYRHLDFAGGLTPEDLKLGSAYDALNAHGVRRHRLDIVTPDTPDDVERVVASEWEEATEKEGPFASAYLQNDAREPGGIIGWSIEGHSWVPLGRSDWPVDSQITEAPWAHMKNETRLSFVEDRKVLTALWTLLQQEGITRQEIHHVERHAQKRATRAGVNPITAQKVQVVTLRKLHRNESERDPDHVPEHREWSHRWLVGGHYRWQACGKGRADRRLTFIAPYVKGPENKPFQAPTRVNAWRR